MAAGARSELMGIVNATPDSFSDGGLFCDPRAAANHAQQLVRDGASWIDIGAESTRPNAPFVSEPDEWKRLEHVLRHVLDSVDATPVSIDTRRPALAARSLAMGARAINDVSAATSHAMLELARQHRVPLVFMHGFPAAAHSLNDQLAKAADVDAIFAQLCARGRDALSRGLSASQIWLDPGLGFGKGSSLSWALLDRIGELVAEGFPVLLGPSRKRFLREAGEPPLSILERDRRTARICQQAAARGVAMFRVHNVALVRSALF